MFAAIRLLPDGHLADAAAHLAGGRGLLLDRAGDGRLEVVDLRDDLADPADHLDRAAGVLLDRVRPGADVLGGPRGLLGQVLDLAGHHGEALARVPGPGGLDGRVQGQQVGLLGDRGDQLDHVADLGRRLAELPTVSRSPGRPRDGDRGDLRGLAGVREISRIDRPISSEPAATVCTLREISSASFAAEDVCASVSLGGVGDLPGHGRELGGRAGQGVGVLPIVAASRGSSRARCPGRAAIWPSSSLVVMPLRWVRSPLASASTSAPSRRTGRRIDRASGMESPISSTRPTEPTIHAARWVSPAASAMATRSSAAAAVTFSFRAPSWSSTAWLRSAIWSVSGTAAEARACLTKSVMKTPKLSTSGRIVANSVARAPVRPHDSTASAASVAEPRRPRRPG
jgi:hypothetical protein